ncbi:hypothetical protein [Formosa algae]|uniref:hypothetical protein n=1 Tax=Formosa algae TaxID=225843 RepID=UPI000CCE13BA|nr:hypothetical protein [Formosa algae]PNW28034.1 hypothetical protein BKP44_10290 [Formosa algae]
MISKSSTIKILFFYKLTLCVLAIILFFSCSSEPSKINYLNNFNQFITHIEDQKSTRSNIDWKTKEDSLNIFLDKKSRFRLNTADEENINKWVDTFNSLKGDLVDSKMNFNFYFENSASMNGYLDGKNFQQVIHRIYGNLDEDDTNSYFVNTQSYPQENILDRIDDKNIKEGDIKNSDHQFIFSNAIENAVNNNLSIVITDGIYSVKDGNVNIVSIDIENAFKKSLIKNEIETVVLKLTSHFKGTYYSETCKPGKKAIKIDQDRPYYVLLFGNSNSINRALNTIAVPSELPGYKEQARFFLTKDLKADFTILTLGEEKHGEFKPVNRGQNIVHNIVDAKKYERPGFGGTPKNESYLQFAIAFDFNNVPLPNTYLENSSNYVIDDQVGYSIVDVKALESMDKSLRTYKETININEKNDSHYSHILTVKADKNLYGDLNIDIMNNLPSWIVATGIDTDCNIKNDSTHTFAFDELMIGISKAYQKINATNSYLNFNLNIKY